MLESARSLVPDPKVFPWRKVCLFASVFTLLVLASATALYWFSFLRGQTVGSVERLVRAEIPLGSERSEVETVLLQHGIKYSKHDVTQGTRLNGQSVPQLATQTDSDIGWTTETYVYDANVDSIYTGMILVYFLFDHDGRLVGHVVHPWVSDQSHVMRWLLEANPPPPPVAD